MEAVTHRGIDARLCGEAVELGPGLARVRLATLPEMGADELGLLHGGFLFGLADYAAMLAVNRPTVVLGAAEVRFHLPVRAGEVLEASARIESEAGKKKFVRVAVERRGDAGVVFTGLFTCFTPERHVLAPPAAAGERP
jgi:acyl-coenzyme A thioesterase PaaI-like protein